MAARKRCKKGEPKTPVSLGGIIYEDSLPSRWVKYPNHYGTFFVFSESQEGFWDFCECSKTPLTNLFKLNKRFPPVQNSNPLRLSPLDSFEVPNEIAEIAEQYPDDPISAFRFQKGLCHRCNLTQPTMRYCHEMYGGKFEQHYGWYINQSYFRYGVSPHGYNYLSEICPNEIQTVVEDYKSALRIYRGFKEEREKSRQLYKKLNRVERVLKKTFNNFTRKEFGFKDVGAGWISETMVFKIVQELLPNYQIIRHYRPDWLERLELDIYVPALRLGIEYQGQQHFKPVKVWGGEKALESLQVRDRKKVQICADKNVTLLHINYTDPLTKHFISKLLLDVGIKLDIV